jgi:hypothetical protein
VENIDSKEEDPEQWNRMRAEKLDDLEGELNSSEEIR